MRQAPCLLPLVIAPLLAAVAASPAHADAEVWTNLETRIPASRPDDAWPDSVRFIAGSRYGVRYPGVGLANLRIGPLWDLAPWLMIGLQTSTYAMQSGPGVFSQEIRGELEPNFRWHVGPWAINDRNRLEYRWQPATTSWRYRNQLRVTWQPKDLTWWPTIWNEVNIDLTGGRVAQNRTAIGIIAGLNDSTRVTVEYIARARQETGAWDLDHVLNLNLFFAPHADDILSAGDSGP